MRKVSFKKRQKSSFSSSEFDTENSGGIWKKKKEEDHCCSTLIRGYTDTKMIDQDISLDNQQYVIQKFERQKVIMADIAK